MAEYYVIFEGRDEYPTRVCSETEYRDSYYHLHPDYRPRVVCGFKTREAAEREFDARTKRARRMYSR